MADAPKTSKQDIQTILTHIQKDAGFRKGLLANPQETLRGVGIEANSEILGALKGLDEKTLEELARSFGTDSVA